MKKTALLFFIFLSINCFAQLSKTHYIPPLTSNPDATYPEDHYIYISTPSVSEVKFKIIPIGGSVISGTVSKSTPYRHTIGSGENTQLFVPRSITGKSSNKGFIIESEGLVYANIRTNSVRNNTGSYNHAGGLVAKGNSALGKRFRAGAMLNTPNISGLLNFISVLATENNTEVRISNIPNGTILANGDVFNAPFPPIILNKNESYIIAINGSAGINLIGALIESSKDIVVNSGSFGGTNDTSNANARDIGFDQIVGADKIGNEYIFIKGQGSIETEKVLLVADEPNTEIFVNGNPIPTQTIQAGEFATLNGNNFLNGNLYVKSSKKVFAYQSIGGITSSANQNLFFVPPLNCSTPKIVDNIPKINEIGSTNYSGVVNIVTEAGANVSINETPIGVAPILINGKSNFVYYSIAGLSGNVAIKSSKQVYVSYYGTNSAATYGSYYSGFDIKPELSIANSTTTSGNCLPNITLKTEPDSDYTYQWFQDDTAISGEGGTGNTLKPTSPGYYQVKRSIPSCSTSNLSDKIPVSNCPTDNDNDSVPDDIDLDFDNDGITNCEESFGNALVDLTGTTLNKYNYSNTYFTTPTYVPATSSVLLSAKNNGDFVSEVPTGINNYTEYKIAFTNPISLSLEYVTNANSTDLINSEGEFIVKSDSNKTVTVLNPTNQLLIDTNYDGIYESGVTQHSSFEIRFRLNSTTPLAAGTGTFSFQSHLTSTITFIHKNLSETTNNKATFSIKAKCIPRDSDSDSTPDYIDLDSDDDGILDIIESQVNTLVGTSVTDANKDGIYDVFGTGTIPQDTDQDSIPDYLDLDSDNDGIKDEIEKDEDQDNDGITNYRDLDRENDGCNDVIEAGFNDGDADGEYGVAPITVNSFGLVNSAPYSIPNADYSIAAPIVITTQPIAQPTCELQNTSIIITDNGGNAYQWQLSIDGVNWNDLSNDTTYSGVNSSSLNINQVRNSMNGYRYRVILSKIGNSCGLISNTVTLTVYALPTLIPSIDLKQCDTDSDRISDFNLTEKNNLISVNASAETFTYYTSLSGAIAKDNSTLISNPTAYTSSSRTIWVRVENANNCFSIEELKLIVSSTQIPASFSKKFELCDDSVNAISTDTDGIAEFDFSSVTQDIKNILPPPDPLNPYSIKYYRNEADALAENNPITNSSNYRNIGYPNEQNIWVRVESTLDNSCFGIGPSIKLIVNPKPSININENGEEDKLVCSNLPEFYVELNSGINDGSPVSNYIYSWTKDDEILSSNSILNVNQEGNYTVKVSTPKGCFRNRIIKVTSSDIAKIENIDIVDLSVNNTVTITTSGKGNYKFSIDLPNGPFQESNFFDNVVSGIRDIYVIDTKGCGTVKKTIAVVGVPKFFTPNQDGFNDFWNIKGIDATFNSKSIIYIFDRYGKLLKQMLPSSIGWDGTLNGAPLPSDDYWFTLELEDGREVKGHFSLKR
jgi:gliding motility-associated-like protein